MSKLESTFQTDLIRELKFLFPGCIVLKNDEQYIQGIPDLLILYNNTWAALECKRSSSEKYRPNQEFYLDKMNSMSYASMVCPQNREEVLYELQQALQSRRSSRISKRV